MRGGESGFKGAVPFDLRRLDNKVVELLRFAWHEAVKGNSSFEAWGTSYERKLFPNPNILLNANIPRLKSNFGERVMHRTPAVRH